SQSPGQRFAEDQVLFFGVEQTSCPHESRPRCPMEQTSLPHDSAHHALRRRLLRPRGLTGSVQLEARRKHLWGQRRSSNLETPFFAQLLAVGINEFEPGSLNSGQDFCPVFDVLRTVAVRLDGSINEEAQQ